MTIVLRLNWQFQISSKSKRLSRENSHKTSKKAVIFNNWQSNTCNIWKHQGTKMMPKYFNPSHDKEFDGTKFLIGVTITKLLLYKFFYEMHFCTQSFINALHWKFQHAPLYWVFANWVTYHRFQEVMAACMRFPLVAGVGILSWYV